VCSISTAALTPSALASRSRVPKSTPPDSCASSLLMAAWLTPERRASSL
jgi:hypothetical protein